MTDPVEVFFPEENTGLRLLGGKVQEVESRLGEHSALDAAGFRKAEPEELPENSIYTPTVYIQEYKIPYSDDGDHLDPDVQTASLYSVATTDGHYFIAEEEEISSYIPELSAEFYGRRE